MDDYLEVEMLITNPSGGGGINHQALSVDGKKFVDYKKNNIIMHKQ